MAITAPATKRDVKSPSVVIALTGAATVLLALRSPHEGGYGFCPVLALTGYLCPTCGGLRAVHDLAHFDLAGAWAMNPLLTIALPLMGIGLAVWWWRAWRGHPPRNIPLPVVFTGLAILIVFGIARNF